ncbi:hypothetical protein [Gorillibacterium timonense]|uniref:hypothetical protein n=1 Tax=Gorillibacterium timonense TaxID=1689269 RepID=UPI00071D13AB|nr:hypothetical protein [Gorillibacterium timonense]
MKIIWLYGVLLLLASAMVVFIDLLSGMSWFSVFHPILYLFRTTSIQESIAIVCFLVAPLVAAWADTRKKKHNRRTKG